MSSEGEGRPLGVPLSVIIADDQAEVRSAMRLVIEQLVGYRVSAEAVDVAQLLASARAAEPDVVLLDWELPGAGLGTSPAALQALREAAPGVRVVAMSARHGARAAARGARVEAFVSKGESPKVLIETLDRLW